MRDKPYQFENRLGAYTAIHGKWMISGPNMEPIYLESGLTGHYDARTVAAVIVRALNQAYEYGLEQGKKR